MAFKMASVQVKKSIGRLMWMKSSKVTPLDVFTQQSLFPLEIKGSPFSSVL